MHYSLCKATSVSNYSIDAHFHQTPNATTKFETCCDSISYPKAEGQLVKSSITIFSI